MYLVDFGIAKLYDPDSHTSTLRQSVTPGYSPLEQYQGIGATAPSSDIYALGATLYHMLTGVVPPDAVQRTQPDSLVPITQLNPTISLNLAAVIGKMMAVYQNQRIQDIPSLRQALAGKQLPQPAQDITMIDRARLQTSLDKTHAVIEARKRQGNRNIIDNLSLTALEATFERLSAIRDILAHDTYDLVFIGKVGTGKTTAICHLFDLIYKTTITRKGSGSKERSISVFKELLSTGSGNTTICEVILRPGSQTTIEIEPRSEEDMRQLIDEFCTRIWAKAYPGNGNDERSAEQFPPEYDKAVRNMVGLKQRREGKEGEGSTTMVDDAQTFALQFGPEQEQLFRAKMLERAELEKRTTCEVPYPDDSEDEDAERVWLQKTFEEVNLVRLPNLSIPKRINITLSANILEPSLFPKLGAIIDTRGLGSSLQRPDLETYIRRRSDALCIYTDLFNQAPTNVIDLMRQFLTAEAQDLASKSVLMVLPKKGEPEKLMGTDGPVNDRDKGIDLRHSYIVNDFTGEKINFDLSNILFYDALQFYRANQSRDNDYEPEEIDAVRRNVFQALQDALNKRELDLWNEVLALELRIQAILGGTGLDPADEDLIEHVKNDLNGYRNQGFYTGDFPQRYISEWMPRHASTLRAVNNRNGRYGPQDIDIYFAADLVAEDHMKKLARRLKDEVKGVIARLDTESAPDSDLKPIARAFQERIDAYFDEFVTATGTKLQEFVEEQALAPKEFWQPVQNRWGRGPGYKRVSNIPVLMPQGFMRLW